MPPLKNSSTFLDALALGSARYERINPFTNEFEFRVEVAPWGNGYFHLFAAFQQVCFHGDMNGRELFRRLRTMGVQLFDGWETIKCTK